MIFGFDLDDTITEFPELFSTLISGLQVTGHRVLVITDSEDKYRDQLMRRLAELNILADELIITSDKRSALVKYNVDYMIDDLPDYYVGLNQRSFAIVGR